MTKDIKGTEAIRKLYRQNETANSYVTQRFSTFIGKLTHNMEIEAIKSSLEQTYPSKLLEIAVGPGRISKNHDFFNLAIGIDTSNPMLKLARENVENQKWDFLSADVMNMPFCNESFDAIVTFRLLRHFVKEERTRAYREIYRVLKKDGILIMDALNSDTGIITKTFDKTFDKTLYYATKLITGKKHSEIYDIKYTKEELEKEITEAGFKLKSIFGIIYAYNLYFPFDLPFKVLQSLKRDKGSLYRITRDKLLSIAIKIEHNRSENENNKNTSYSWVIVCVKK